MAVNESQVLRWVARQWQRLNGKDEISGVDGHVPTRPDRVLQEQMLEGRLFWYVLFYPYVGLYTQ